VAGAPEHSKLSSIAARSSGGVSMSQRTTELTRLICMGLGRRFEETACEHFSRGTGECALLNGGRMTDLVENSRCTWEMMEHALLRFEKKRICDDGADIRFDDLFRRFKLADIHDSRPTGWFRYVERAVMRACLEILRKRGAFRRESCGNCEHFTQSYPHVCVQSGIPKRKTDERCEHYSPVARGPVQDRSGSAPEFKNRQDADPWDSVNAIIDADALNRELRKRATSSKPQSKERERHQRQYEVFVHLLHSFRAGLSQDEALARTQEQSGMSRKTLLRDMDDIRQFFAEKMSVNAPIEHLSSVEREWRKDP
jgi:hypothetical protein